jgi:hypothetical protein
MEVSIIRISKVCNRSQFFIDIFLPLYLFRIIAKKQKISNLFLQIRQSKLQKGIGLSLQGFIKQNYFT